MFVLREKRSVDAFTPLLAAQIAVAHQKGSAISLRYRFQAHVPGELLFRAIPLFSDSFKECRGKNIPHLFSQLRGTPVSSKTLFKKFKNISLDFRVFVFQMLETPHNFDLALDVVDPLYYSVVVR